MNRAKWIVKFLVFGIVMLAVIGLVTQLLWNWLVPVLFNGPLLTFWQALGLLVLTKILFWSFGKGGSHWRHRQGHRGYYWAEKWKTMSPEERDRFKQRMKEKWCAPRANPVQNAPVENSGTSNV